jgi:hypothetical protein
MNVSSVSLGVQPDFSGLWGKIKYSHTEMMYGKEYECEYYEQEYHPCIDEKKEEIEKKLLHQESLLNAVNKNEDPSSCNGDYISVKCGDRLNLTKAELEELQLDCIRVINEELPTGKILDVLS